MKFEKNITLALIVTFLFSPIFATKVEAQLFVPVWDPGTFSVNADTAVNTTSLSLKELGFDGVAFMIINYIIERMAASTVNWINSGFKGQPAFVTNPEAFFTDIGDKVAGQYIFSNPNLRFLCGPISAKIKLALTQSYIQEKQYQCTLTQVGRNFDDFMGNFENGGWDNFFELTQKQQNNPIGAYLQAESELLEKIANKKDLKEKDLLQGKGFLSYQKCKRYAGNVTPGTGSSATTGTKPMVCVKRAPLDSSPDSGKCLEEKEVTIDSYGNQINTDDIGPGAEGACLEHETETPGSVISEQLNKTLGIGGEKLAAADEINEIVSALLNQLVTRAIGTVAGGLRSLSKPDSTGKIFTDQLINEENDAKIDKGALIDKYYKDSRKNVEEVTGLPTYDPYVCRDNPNLPECQPPSGSPQIVAPACDPTSPLYNPSDPSCDTTQ